MQAIIFVQMDFWYQIVFSETKSLAHTTLGLKGGSMSLFSSAGQLMVLKKGCTRTSPTTPNLRLGSRSNNWNNERDIQFHYRKKHKTTTGNTVTWKRKNSCHYIHSFCISLIKSIIHQFKQVLGLLGDPPRVVRDFRPDGFKQLILIVTLERWLTNQHLIH